MRKTQQISQHLYNLNKTKPCNNGSQTFSDGIPFVGPVLPACSTLFHETSFYQISFDHKFGRPNLTQTQHERNSMCTPGEKMAVIQARTILIGFHTKLGSFKFALQRKHFKYFSNMLQLEKDVSIVVSDLEVYAKHLKNLSEDCSSKVRQSGNPVQPRVVLPG